MNYEQLQELGDRIGTVSQGFTDDEIDRIPTRKWESYINTADCAICLDHIKHGHIVMDLPCNHNFHEECVVQHLKEKKTCPECMQEVTLHF